LSAADFVTFFLALLEGFEQGAVFGVLALAFRLVAWFAAVLGEAAAAVAPVEVLVVFGGLGEVLGHLSAPGLMVTVTRSPATALVRLMLVFFPGMNSRIGESALCISTKAMVICSWRWTASGLGPGIPGSRGSAIGHPFVRQISTRRFAWASRRRSLLVESLKKPRSALFSARLMELPSAASFSICGPHFRWDQWTRTRYLLVVGKFPPFDFLVDGV
jgi:hypothetical protein